MASSAPLLFLHACLLLLLPLLPTSAQRSTYVIHMNTSSMPASHPTHHDWYAAILENMSLATPDSTTSGRPHLLHTYHHALTGFAAALTADELRAIEGSYGFVAAYPDLEIKLHTTRTPQFLYLNHDTGLWPSSSYGDGVLIGARSFNVSSSPADGGGASFFGYANGTAVGMAPRAWISVYEVADARALAAFTANVLAAMDAAIADRVDIAAVNASEAAAAVSEFLGPVIAAPAIGTYSSRGPSLISPDILKPDVVAPGTRILGAWPTNKPAATAGAMSLASPFAVRSGTSLASAHVAGIAALLQGAKYHSWSPAAIRSAMMTTAYQLDNTGDPIKDSAANSEATPLGMGAGHVDPNRALHPGLVYDAGEADYVSFLCSQGFSQEQVMAIAQSPEPQSFKRTVTNVDWKPAVYRAFVRHPVGFTVTVQPEVLVFNATTAINTADFVLAIVQNEEPVAMVSSGSLTWVHEELTYTVRSPIVVVAETAPAFP
ncbi:hypothetical protein BHM03_00007900 [Ensete ventricosum]|nr:hypothetical protein BHM03_00007900 [Ensete ventricosum]